MTEGPQVCKSSPQFPGIELKCCFISFLRRAWVSPGPTYSRHIITLQSHQAVDYRRSPIPISRSSPAIPNSPSIAQNCDCCCCCCSMYAATISQPTLHLVVPLVWETGSFRMFLSTNESQDAVIFITSVQSLLEWAAAAQSVQKAMSCARKT